MRLSQDGLVTQISFDIQRHPTGRCVATTAIFLQCLQDNAIQVAFQLVGEPIGMGRRVLGDPLSAVVEIANGQTGRNRIFLANDLKCSYE